MDLTGMCAYAWLAIQETSAKSVSWLYTRYNGRDLYTLLDIDECDPVPCRNGGTCFDGINEYRCHCMAGYTGDVCEIGELASCKV